MFTLTQVRVRDVFLLAGTISPDWSRAVRLFGTLLFWTPSDHAGRAGMSTKQHCVYTIRWWIFHDQNHPKYMVHSQRPKKYFKFCVLTNWMFTLRDLCIMKSPSGNSKLKIVRRSLGSGNGNSPARCRRLNNLMRFWNSLPPDTPIPALPLYHTGPLDNIQPFGSMRDQLW